MPPIERLDSPNSTVRVIERWKRGVAVAIFAALGLLPGFVAGAFAMYVGELIAGETAAVVAGVFAFLAFAPWGLGKRQAIRQIGEIAGN